MSNFINTSQPLIKEQFNHAQKKG